jgi:hypothetical protein
LELVHRFAGQVQDPGWPQTPAGQLDRLAQPAISLMDTIPGQGVTKNGTFMTKSGA